MPSTSTISNGILVKQYPHESNGMVAILYVYNTTGDSTSAFSVVVDGKQCGESDPSKIYEQANQQAQAMLQTTSKTESVPRHNGTSTPITGKDSYHGGGNRPITPSQVNLIQNLFAEMRIDPAPYLNEKGISDIRSIKGHEADSIIKDLKEMKTLRR